MIRTILIDDEETSLTTLKYDLETYCAGIEVVSMHTSPVDGLHAIRIEKPDLVFLDIQMPEMNGFQLLESVGKIDFRVIFVTAFDDYALKAFDFNAMDYILKPVRKEKLVQTVDKVQEELSSRLDVADIKALLHNIEFQQSKQIQTISVPTGNGFELIQTADITHLRAENNYTWIYCASGQKYLITKQINKIDDILPEHTFYRSHKSYIVNIQHASRYVRGSGGYLILKDNTEVPVARNRKAGLMSLLNI